MKMIGVLVKIGILACFVVDFLGRFVVVFGVFLVENISFNLFNPSSTLQPFKGFS